VTANQQGALERLGYSNESYVSEENRDYFRDVHDHNRHLHHRAVQGLEKLAWALDTVRVSDSRRTQNAVRWGVAMVTAFLLPLVVVSSLSLPPEVFALTDQVPTVAVGVVVAYVIGVLLILKQKRWF
jgi:Mg2+ and Co2+ transporter CorA